MLNDDRRNRSKSKHNKNIKGFNVYQNVNNQRRRLSSRSRQKAPVQYANFFERIRTMNFQRIKSYWLSRRGLKMTLKLLGLGIFLGVIFIGIMIILIQKNIPQIKSIYGQNLGGSIQYYDRTGKVLLWSDYNAINRTPISGNLMSPYIRNATVSIEDKYFYTEGAIDVGGILRSAAHDLLDPNGQIEGGSTITQQLVKLYEGWTGQMTIYRKIKEVFLAYDLSKEYSKSTILTGYLNIVPYGGVDYGIEAAAQDYFRTTPAKLSLAQAAMLAAIPQAPAYYSPRSPEFDQQALIARKNYILGLMYAQHYISKSQEQNAIKVDVLSQVQPALDKYSNVIAPYFVLSAKQQLESQFSNLNSRQVGWKVITTLSIPQQNEAQKLVANNLGNVQNDGGNEEAMVVENAPTGQVTAQVGGVNFFNPNYGQINYSTIQINPGSTFKLYDYTALINNNNAGAGSVLYDSQGPLPGYPCTNKALPLNGGNCLYDYDFQYPGPLTLRYALAGSRNVPAVKAALINGMSNTISLATKMGLTSGYNCYANSQRTIKTTCYGSAAIGEGGYLRLNESVNGFATDARLGNYVPQTYILKVINSQNQVVYQWKQPPVNQVVKPDAAYIIDNILSDPRATYLPGSCWATNCTTESQFGWKFQRTNGWDVAIKTGTTHADQTGLMMGMTTQYVVGSWVGYYTATKPLIPHYGGLEGLTEPLTRGMITYLTQGQKPINWQPPAGIKTLPAYVVNFPPAQVMGHYYGWEYPSPSQDIYPSWYNPPKYNGVVTIDKVSGLLATSCTPALAKSTIDGNGPNIFSIDTFYNSGATVNIPTKFDNIHQCSDQSPTISLQQTVCDNVTKLCSYQVNVTQGTYPLSGGTYTSAPAGTISLLDNGKTLQTINIPTTSTSSYLTTFTNIPVNQGDSITATVVDSVLYSSTSTPSIVNLTSTSGSATNSANTTTGSTTTGTGTTQGG